MARTMNRTLDELKVIKKKFTDAKMPFFPFCRKQLHLSNGRAMTLYGQMSRNKFLSVKKRTKATKKSSR